MKPTPRKPKIIIAQVEGSGTAVTAATYPVSPTVPSGLVPVAVSQMSEAKISGGKVSRLASVRPASVKVNVLYWLPTTFPVLGLKRMAYSQVGSFEGFPEVKGGEVNEPEPLLGVAMEARVVLEALVTLFDIVMLPTSESVESGSRLNSNAWFGELAAMNQTFVASVSTNCRLPPTCFTSTVP